MRGFPAKSSIFDEVRKLHLLDTSIVHSQRAADSFALHHSKPSLVETIRRPEPRNIRSIGARNRRLAPDRLKVGFDWQADGFEGAPAILSQVDLRRLFCEYVLSSHSRGGLPTHHLAEYPYRWTKRPGTP